MISTEIIPRFFSLLSDNQPLTIQGSGLNVRRYLYGADAADGFDLLLHKGSVGEAYNLISSYAVTNLEVAVRMLESFGYSPQKDFHHRLAWIADRPFNDRDYRVNGSKLEALGWRQRVSFAKGLRTTVEWYRGNIHCWWPNVSEKSSVSSMTKAGSDVPIHVGTKRVTGVHDQVNRGKLNNMEDEGALTNIGGGSNPIEALG